MWRVTATGTEGRTYVYEVDAPDYAPEDAVWESACRQHGQERKARKITETLDIRPAMRKVELIYPQGSKPMTREEILAEAAQRGLTLEAGDIQESPTGLTVDGMDAREWLTEMSAG
jgi:hypothetical protein